ncbi:MAG: signal peptidase I [Gemmatimonadales bacterium]|nr:signal peptidase I [Gemmatimonadales bacterium]
MLRTFLIEAFRIPTGSMEPTLLPGDFLFVNKALYGAEVPFVHRFLPAVRQPRAGDIVIFDSVEEPGTKLVKRVAGVPGDTLSMVDGSLVRNGRSIPEPYVVRAQPAKRETAGMREKMREWQLPHLVRGDDTREYDPDLADWGPIVVPPDSLFTLGDNRDESYDGRYWGFLARRAVRGHPLVIYFSYDPAGPRAAPYLTAMRWRRIFSSPE